MEVVNAFGKSQNYNLKFNCFPHAVFDYDPSKDSVVKVTVFH